MDVKRNALCLALLLLCPLCAQAQPNVFRSHSFPIAADTTRLDTLSIVPRSLVLRGEQGHIVPDSLYAVDYANATLITTQRMSKATAAYRVFPVSFSQPIFNKNQGDFLRPDIYSPESSPYFVPGSTGRHQSQGLFAQSGLEHSGSLMRGINVSTNSSASLTSEMNLQLSGKLTDELNLLVTISDNNLPALPEGNTVSLQEVDRIFISVFTDKTSLTAGDLDLIETADFFGQYRRKVLGTSFQHMIVGNQQPTIGNGQSATTDNRQSSIINSQLSAGVSKGKFARQFLAVADGNQGAYLLTGAEGERNIVVLSGSERVFVDGILQERGADADYIISYATAEITFMPRRVITQFSRVMVEFEYSERSFARYLVTSQNAAQGEKFTLYLNAFFESDAKNQPIDEHLSDAHRQLMATAGAQHWRATAIGADSLAPLITPKRQMLITTGGTFTPDSLTTLALDAALSNRHVNLFSDDPQAETTGVGVNLSGSKAWRTGANSSVITDARVFAFDKKFDTPERFTTPEYERDWNIEGALQHRELQQYTGTVGYRYRQSLALNATASLLALGAAVGVPIAASPPSGEVGGNSEGLGGTAMQGKKLGADVLFRQRGFVGVARGSFLQTQQSNRNTQFARGAAELSRAVGRYTVGFLHEFEHNEVEANGELQHGYQTFHAEELFLRTDSTAAHHLRLAARIRTDFSPQGNVLEKFMTAREASATSVFSGSVIQNRLTATYRNLQYADSATTQNLILGREEIFLTLAQGAISTSVLYELGSGMELKQDFIYVDVGTGQGIYVWRDYNGNGIKELDEFEIAAFRDEASYIRVALPSREYVQTYSGKFAFQLSLVPAALWQGAEGTKGVLSRFSHLFSYSNAHKNLRGNLAQTANPFFGAALADTGVVSQAFSAVNTLSYLSRTARTRLELSWQQSAAKQLLINGFENHQSTTLRLNAHRRIIDPLRLTAGVERGERVFLSQYALADRNYHVQQHAVLTGSELTPTTRLRLNAKYTFSVKENTLHTETALLHDAGVEATYNIPQKGVVTGSAGFVSTTFDGEAHSAVGYEMLQGYSVGRNLTWGTTLRRGLGNGLELSLLYAGRRLATNHIIHSGSVELRLLF